MKKILILIVLTAITFVLRYYQVGLLPSILNRDEAALGYNAYLLKQTGTDEWGVRWPLSLQSFGDYKLAGYPLLIIPFFSLLGLTETAVRWPSVLAGILLIPLSYFFAKALRFSSKKSLIFAFLVATTPVFLFYSRMAFEANVALTLFVAALGMLFLPSEKRAFVFTDVLGILLTLAATLTYNTPLLLLPFIIALLPYWRGFKDSRRWLFAVGGLTAVMLFAGFQLLSVSSQKSGITIFQDETVWTRSVEFRESLPGVLKHVLGNRVVVYGQIILSNYAKSLSPVFLVQGKGGHPWHTVPGTGHILWVTYIFAIVGLLSQLATIIKNRKKLAELEPKRSILLLYLLCISLLPAVITVDAPHATRSLFTFFIIVLLASEGLLLLVNIVSKKYRTFLFIAFIAIIIGLFTYYVKNYFLIFPSEQHNFRPGFQENISTIESMYPEGSVAIVDDEGYHYILLAWYLKLTPEQYFSTVVRQMPDKIGFRYGEKVDRYHFIAKSDDRSEQEKIMLKWYKGAWELTTY